MEASTFRRLALLSLTLSLSLNAASTVAQQSQRQAALEGHWEWQRAGVPAETLLDLQAEGLLTAEAEAYRAAWNIELDDQSQCRRQSPAAFGGSAPNLEILNAGEIIYILAFDQIRRVYMDGREKPIGFWPNKLGWSEGRWQGDTLVVTTTDLTLGTIDQGNRPLPFGGAEAEMVERFTLREGGTLLSVELDLSDPKYYISPLELRFDFARAEDRTLYAVDCVPSGVY